jgi:hypothetical protein
MKYLRYLRTVLRHKLNVCRGCWQMYVPFYWALLHDWDKFLPWMFIAYANYFAKTRRDAEGNYHRTTGEDSAFDYAWNAHQKLNGHHWQHWVLYRDDGSIETLPMPDRHRREMLADWIGAGRTYDPKWTPASTRDWYLKERYNMELHPITRRWVESMLEVPKPVQWEAIR